MQTKFSHLFVKFFIPYLIVIFIMTILTSIIYVAAFKEIEKNAIKMQQSYIEQSKAVLDRRFKEAIDSSLQISRLPTVITFKTKTNRLLQSNYYSAVTLLRQLNNYRFTNEIIEGYYIFYKNSGIIANSDQIFYYKNISATTFLDLDYEKNEFWNMLFSKFYKSQLLPINNFSINGLKVEGIPVLTTIGYSYDDPEAVVLLILNAEKLKQNMFDFEKNLNGNFIMLNNKNEKLIDLVNDDNNMEKSDKNLTFRTKSDIVPWDYMLVQPEENVFKDIRNLKNAGLLLMIIVLLVGILISFFSARNNSRPIYKLMDNHEALNERLQNQRPYLRRTFLERWLKGNYSNIEEVIAITKYLKADYFGELYCVAVIDYKESVSFLDKIVTTDMSKLEIKRLTIRDIITKDLFQPEYIHDVSHDKLALIFISKESDKNSFFTAIHNKTKECKSILEKMNFYDINIGIGNIYSNISEVSTSLNDSLDAVNSVPLQTKSTIVWYSNLVDNEDSYYFPSEIENRLYNCTRSGDTEQVDQIFLLLIDKNLIERCLTGSMLKLFSFELWGTLAKIQDKDLNNNSKIRDLIKNSFDKMEHLGDIDKIKYCKEVFTGIAKIIKSNDLDKHDKVMDEITQYINENFKDPLFCLPMISDKFNLSYAYLSQIFKDFNGDNFVNYLQNLRMKEAERLLRETDAPIKDIVFACGYNSSNTFGKAFKRIHGVTASTYRERL